ncbi:hypothetical protein E4U43_005595 [Claviceps pusilla]|uniref:Tetratricopeptide repeat protein 1 (TTC1) n=1 Tax=Claviceps pusilla TaxID=123648 RepID=A0A9P7N4C4_9HYPO|nr:hypothetical protein E4U43_005595 [Claviceps pusilla]
MTRPTDQTVPASERREANRADPKRNAEDAQEVMVRFSPEEERALLDESNATKAEANILYSTNDYDAALSRYQDALSTCPNYLHYERAVVQSNMAACYLQLEQWKEAIKAATSALDGLATLNGKDKDKENETEQETKQEQEARPAGACGSDTNDKQQQQGSQPQHKDKSPSFPSQAGPKKEDADEMIEDEIVSAGATRAAQGGPPSRSSQPDDDDTSTSGVAAATVAESKRKEDVRRIRTKALLRRARARAEAGGWQNLAGAEEDYKLLSEMPGLGAADLRTVRRQLAALPARTKAAQETEMAEMWGKLRTLGDGILKPFGLSTNNFQMVKDEKTGGYSMNFTSGDGKK